MSIQYIQLKSSFLNADSFKGLLYALGLCKGCTLPRIHVYGFSKAEDPEFDFYEVYSLTCVISRIYLARPNLSSHISWICCYLLPHLQRIRIVVSEVALDVQMHRVRLVAPGKWMLCASFVLPERVAYFRRGYILWRRKLCFMYNIDIDILLTILLHWNKPHIVGDCYLMWKVKLGQVKFYQDIYDNFQEYLGRILMIDKIKWRT